ncbi:MAG: hypothetical protein OEY21_07745, partial [Nitrospira sp.]|nr:hypothetical protein [Nitrospira sp.]
MNWQVQEGGAHGLLSPSVRCWLAWPLAGQLPPTTCRIPVYAPLRVGQRCEGQDKENPPPPLRRQLKVRQVQLLELR